MATNLEFIKSVETTSTVTSLDISNVFTATYDVYFLSLESYEAAGTGSGTFPYIDFRYLKASDGSADTTSNYDYAYVELNQTAAFGDGNNTDQSVFRCAITSGVDAWAGGLSMYIFNPFDSGLYTYTNSQTAIYYSGGNYPLGYKAISAHKVAQSNSGMQLQLGVDACKINMYGVK